MSKRTKPYYLYTTTMICVGSRTNTPLFTLGNDQKLGYFVKMGINFHKNKINQFCTLYKSSRR